MRVEIHPEAAGEANEAYNWYKDRAPALADDFDGEVFRIIDTAFAHPRMWKLWPSVAAKYRVRRALLDRFPFAIAYLVEDDVLKVIAVAHLRRRPGYWLKRLRSVK
jgi:toxin ParE1/3/4